MEFTPLTIGALGVELALVLLGAALLWRRDLSPAARASRGAPALRPWDIGAFEIALLLWVVIIGGFVAQVAFVGLLTALKVGNTAREVVGGVGFQFGMLAGCLGFMRFVERARDYSKPRAGFARAGLETFLKVLPLIFVTGLLWSGLMKLLGVELDQQELVGLLSSTKSPWVVGTLIVMAVVVAPVTEELIFRAGLFRYLNSRPPLAVLFAALAGGAVAVFGFVGLSRFTQGRAAAGSFAFVWAVTIALAAVLLTLSPTVKRLLRQPTPRWVALLVPALLFGSLHANLASFPQLVVLGIVFSLAYERTDNIAVPMLAHALFNLNTLLLVLSGLNA